MSDDETIIVDEDTIIEAEIIEPENIPPSGDIGTPPLTPYPGDTMSDETRREKFGIWGDCTVSCDTDHTVKVVIDAPLPDKDKITIETDEAKAAKILSTAVAGMLLNAPPEMKFFDGK